MSEYKFERLAKENLKDLEVLYKKAFNETTTLDFLSKKYNTEMFGLSKIGYLAYSSSNEPAAYYGVFPVKVQFENKEILAAQSGDTMTHPNHRGKGLFITLAKMTYELAKSSGIEFVFGFPNQNSYPGFINKLNWKHYSNINHYKIKTGVLPFEKAAKKIGFFNGIYQSLFLSRLNKLITKNIFPNSLTSQLKDYGNIIHDLNYFDYKTYYQSYTIEINGIKCKIKIDGRLWVGDIEFCTKEKFFEMVAQLILLSKKLYCSTLQFSVFENSLYDIWLKENYTIHSQNSVGCLDLTKKFDVEKFAYQAFDFDTF